MNGLMTRVEWTLTPVGGGTRLDLLHQGLSSDADGFGLLVAFDAGWDAMRAETVARQKRLGVIPQGTDDAPRPDTLPRWDSLTADQKRLYARYMEAYAASLAYADAA